MYQCFEGRILIQLFQQLQDKDIPLLSEKMWEFMENLPAVLSQEDLSSLWLIVFKTLRNRSKKALIKLIENDEEIRKKLSFIFKSRYADVFDSVWLAWLKVLKKTQNNQSRVYIDKFICNYEEWKVYLVDKESDVSLLENQL